MLLGITVGEAVRSIGVSEQTYYRWHKKYGGMKACDAKRFRELEQKRQTQKIGSGVESGQCDP